MNLFDRGIRFKEKAIIKHNGKYDYSLVNYQGNQVKVTIVCPTHGTFEQTPNTHLYSNGCMKCYRDRQRYSVDEFIQKASDIHNNKYDYSLVTSFTNARTKVTILCPHHGPFMQMPFNHLSGTGCPDCSANDRSVALSLTKDDILQRFHQVHGNRYDYADVIYPNVRNHVEIICRDHGKFVLQPRSHLSGAGCPVCHKGKSRKADLWLDHLNIASLIREYKLLEIPKAPVDGYDPLTNTVYQFHGDYWHGNPASFDSEYYNKQAKRTMGELYERTLLADNQIREWGYNLVVMWENDWKKSRHNRKDAS